MIPDNRVFEIFKNAFHAALNERAENDSPEEWYAITRLMMRMSQGKFVCPKCGSKLEIGLPPFHGK